MVNMASALFCGKYCICGTCWVHTCLLSTQVDMGFAVIYAVSRYLDQPVNSYIYTQVEKVKSIQDLSKCLSFGDTINMHGREIHLNDSPPTNSLETRPQVFKSNAGIPCPGGTTPSWEVKDAPVATCWELIQPKSVLADLTIHIPADGQLHVHVQSAEWRNVHIHGPLLSWHELFTASLFHNASAHFTADSHCKRVILIRVFLTAISYSPLH